ncbi:hypothetical protein GMOD_00009428 [Pyrenophora seminiperda CCB06]|uniref:Uncharacterized protein n=1 Tax=Pyrenophora seminiperda CCB06 TaxID=1302712 RepID=A0A3M7MGS8_9PLEO|nr:hypothetical protein GMOD_00009428 [Pyrenophora seminiperda CCB06]
MSKTSLIEDLLASWTDLEDNVNVMTIGSQETKQLTKANVKSHFDSHGLPPIACHRLPASCIPKDIATINVSRNNPDLFQFMLQQDPYQICQQHLLQAQYETGTYFTKGEIYLLAEEGESVVQANGRPLKAFERAQLELNPMAVHLTHTLPLDIPMKKNIVMILPAYTLYRIVAKENSLITTGSILPKIRSGTYEECTEVMRKLR